MKHYAVFKRLKKSIKNKYHSQVTNTNGLSTFVFMDSRLANKLIAYL